MEDDDSYSRLWGLLIDASVAFTLVMSLIILGQIV